MDPYDHRHHQYGHRRNDARYVSLPPPPPLPPPHAPSRFPDDLNFHHRLHDRLPPPPPLPQRPPHSFQYYPSPPRIPAEHHPYPHHQPRFVDEHPPRIREPPDFKQDVWDPPRVYRQDDRIVRPDDRIVRPDDRIVRPDERIVRPDDRILQWDHPPRQFNNRPMSPPPPYRDPKRYDFDDNGSRPREGFSFGKIPREGLDWNKKEEFAWGEREIDHRNINNRRSRGPSSSSSVGFTFGKGREEPSGENMRWGSAKVAPREIASLGHKPAVVRVETEGKLGSELWLNDDGEEFWSARGKRLHSQLKNDNFSSMAKREGSQEFVDNSKPKVKRTSALLRVGKTPQKWKDEESEFFGEVNAGSSSQRDSLDFEEGSVTESRMESAVDLDVSFKSNALVAKAIVPPSEHLIGSDGRSTPNSNKKSRVLTPVFSVSSPRVTEIHEKSPSCRGSYERTSPNNKKRKVITPAVSVTNPIATEINEKSPGEDGFIQKLDALTSYDNDFTPPKDKASFVGDGTAVASVEQPSLENRTSSSVVRSAKKMLNVDGPTHYLDYTSEANMSSMQSENKICPNKTNSLPKTSTKEITHLSGTVDIEPLNEDSLTLKLGVASPCSIELFQSSNEVVNTGIRTGGVCLQQCLDSSKQVSPLISTVCSDEKPLCGNRSTLSPKVKQSKTNVSVSGDGTCSRSLSVSGKATSSSSVKSPSKELNSMHSHDKASNSDKVVSLTHSKEDVSSARNGLSVSLDTTKEKSTSNPTVGSDVMLNKESSPRSLDDKGSKERSATSTLGIGDAVDNVSNDKPLSGNKSPVEVNARLTSDKSLTQLRGEAPFSRLEFEDCIGSQPSLNKISLPNEATKKDSTSSSTMVVTKPLNGDSLTPALDITLHSDDGISPAKEMETVSGTVVVCTPKTKKKRKRKNKNVAVTVTAPVTNENVSITALPAAVTNTSVPVSCLAEVLGKSSIENNHLGSPAGSVVPSPKPKNRRKKKIKKTVPEIGLQTSVVEANMPVSALSASVREVEVVCRDNSFNGANVTLDSFRSSTKSEDEVILVSSGTTDDDHLRTSNDMVNTSFMKRDAIPLLPISSFGAKKAEILNADMSSDFEKASMRSDNSLMQSEEKAQNSNLDRTNLSHKNTTPGKLIFMDELSGTHKRKRKKNRGVDTFLGLSSSRPTNIHGNLDTHSADSALPAEKCSKQSEVLATFPGIKLENDGVKSLHKVDVQSEKTEIVESLPSAVLGSAIAPQAKRKSVFERISCFSGSGVIKIHEGSGHSDRPDYLVDPPNYEKRRQNIKEKVVLSSVGTVDDHSSHRKPSLLENSLKEILPANNFSVSNTVEDHDGISAQPDILSGSLVDNSANPNGHSLSLLATGNSLQCALPNDDLEIKNGERADDVVDASGEPGMVSREKSEQIVLHSLVQEKFPSLPLELQTSVFNPRSASNVMKNDVYALLENAASSPPSTYNDVQSREEASGTSITNSNDEVVDSLHARQIGTDDQYSPLTVKDLQKEQTSDTDGNMLSDQTEDTEHAIQKKPLVLSLQKPLVLSLPKPLVLSLPKQQTTSSLIRKVGERIGGNVSQGSSLSRALPGRPSIPRASIKKTDTVKQIAGPRTWHRTGNPLPQIAPSVSSGSSQRHTAKKIQSTSYIRKGNSLVRSCVPTATIPQTSAGLTNSSSLLNRVGKAEPRSTVSEHKVSFSDLKNFSTAGLERPKTPPLSHNIKLPVSSSKSSLAVAPSTLPCLFSEGASETATIPASKNADNHVGASEIQKVADKESEQLVLSEDAKSQSSRRKEITYVKPKSNQLVASCSTEDHDSSSAVERHTLNSCIPSDQYYKKNKNQLIRNAPALRSPLMEAANAADGGSISESQRGLDVSSLQKNRTMQKQKLNKAFVESHKASRLSLVWTLHGTQKQDASSFQRHKVYPVLFPWKRTTRFKFNSIFSKSSFSRISKKLLLSHKRDTVYTRSTGGFSLRKSKVLSIGGSNLKWSKSIEDRSKKANEEATLAVAAIERKKREQKGVVVRTTKRRNQSSRERIFRIGSVRYKMDASKHSLQRIPDEESSCVAGSQTAKDTRKAFIPKRLLIDNDEYIRIGNGNKLVRDPKKLVRILASEKVRWSLHTVRLRLARKQQYCQFFTRFGECNKGDGKCPYIHDPSKIAVCTMFLKGSCSSANCKLTHKVIPERMEDCSYFLQGLCTNDSCPYRHVNVNPSASVCEGFLRGYCASGNECRKKHSYVCPIFKSTGVCPQRLICKLRHPKKEIKIKRKSKALKHKQGRYFGTELSDKAVCSDKHTEKKSEDIFTSDGGLAEYISIDVSDDEFLDIGDPDGKYTKLCGNDSDIQPAEVDELIKPVLLMNKNPS